MTAIPTSLQVLQTLLGRLQGAISDQQLCKLPSMRTETAKVLLIMFVCMHVWRRLWIESDRSLRLVLLILYGNAHRLEKVLLQGSRKERKELSCRVIQSSVRSVIGNLIELGLETTYWVESGFYITVPNWQIKHQIMQKMQADVYRILPLLEHGSSSSDMLTTSEITPSHRKQSLKGGEICIMACKLHWTKMWDLTERPSTVL